MTTLMTIAVYALAFSVLCFAIVIFAWLRNIAGIFSKIEEILQQPVQKPPSSVAQVQILLDGKKGLTMFPLQDSKSVTASIALEDALGVVVPGAALDASPAPSWTLDDASFGTLTPSADNLSCVFQPNGKQGVVHMRFSGSVNGAGFNAESDDIQVQPGPVAQVAMSLV